MTHAEKKRRTSMSDPTPQQQQHPPMVALPPPLVPYHPHMIPMMPYPVYHPHAAHPQYYISVASPQSTSQPPPSHVLETASGKSPSIVATEPPTGSAIPSPRYERILPKRPSDATVAVMSGSPSSSPLGPHPSPYAYSLQPSPLSLPHPPPSHQQHSTADQREQARKISHSAIERRRREKINDKIMQLKSIIPACADQENLHKMSILQSAIDYIQYLKGIVDEKQQQQNQGTQPSQPSTNLPSSSSSSSLAPTKDCDPPPTPTTPSFGGESSPVASISALEPLKPIDIMNSNRQTPYHSSPPYSLVSPTSLEKNSHMKLDHLLS